MNTPLEKLSLIASAFEVVDDVTADGNRAANARQTIRDVLAGHLVHVVSAGTYDVRTRERDEETKRADYWEEECETIERIFDAAVIGDGTADKVTNKAREAVETIAKLTADNAALRDSLRAAAAQVQGVAEEDVVDPTLATPNPGAGWVSPEEHAAALTRAQEAKEKMRQTWLDRLSDLNGEKLVAIVERDAARARLAEVERERNTIAARARDAAQILRAATPDVNAGPTNVDEYATRAAKHIAHLESRLAEAAKHWSDVDTNGDGDSFAEGSQLVKQMRARLAEFEDDAAKVLAEKCANDEQHCVCVPHLRAALRECLASPTPAIEPVDTEAK